MRTKQDVYSVLVQDPESLMDSAQYVTWNQDDETSFDLDVEPYSDDEREDLRRLMQRRVLAPLFKQLSRTQRIVLERRLAGHREVDIARDLGIGQPGVSMSYKRAIARLQVLKQLPQIEWDEWRAVVTPYVERCVLDRSSARQQRIDHRVRVLYTLYCTSSYQRTVDVEGCCRGAIRGYAYQLRDALAQDATAIGARYHRWWTTLLDHLGVRAVQNREVGYENRQAGAAA